MFKIFRNHARHKASPAAEYAEAPGAVKTKWLVPGGESAEGGHQRVLKDRFLVIGKEADLDGNLEKADFQRIRDPPVVHNPLAVLLRGGHNGGRMLLDGGHYVPDVETVVVVMIHEVEPLDDLVLVTEVHPKRCVVRYSREKDKFLGVGVPRIALLEDRLHGVVPRRREQKRLDGTFPVGTRAGFQVIVLETERLRPQDLLPVLKIGRTLRHDDDVGVVKPLGQIPEPSERKELILVGRAVVVHQNDVEVRP